MARETWSDERLDDLATRMDKGFDEVKGEVREVKKEVGELRKEMSSRATSIDARLDALQRTMVLGVVGMSASIVGALFAVQL